MKHEVLSNKTVWISGASSGIGLEVARMLAKARNYIYVSARSEDKLLALKEAYPENIHVIPMDVTSASSMAAAEARLNELTDHLDIFISCVGTCEYDDGPRLPADHFARITQTNYLGTVEAVRIALPLLKKSTFSAHIVAISSLAALVPFPRAAAYGASKAALEYFLQSLRIDVQRDNIDVTIVRPGWVDTPLTRGTEFKMPFIMPSKQAAEHIVFAISKRKIFADFPKRMSVPLKIMRLAPLLWMKAFAPKFRKPELL